MLETKSSTLGNEPNAKVKRRQLKLALIFDVLVCSFFKNCLYIV